MMAGTTHSNHTNPVVRGVVHRAEADVHQDPAADGDLARREGQAARPLLGQDRARALHRSTAQDPVCASCHQLMDPVGLALENFDAVGLWRDQENGVTIDASGAVPGAPGDVERAGRAGAASWPTAEATHSLLRRALAELRLRPHARAPTTSALQAAVNAAFHESGYDVQQLLLALTQTDAFLYLPGERGVTAMARLPLQPTSRAARGRQHRHRAALAGDHGRRAARAQAAAPGPRRASSRVYTPGGTGAGDKY